MTDLQLSVLLSDVENMRMRIGALEMRLGEDVVPVAEPKVEEPIAEPEPAPAPAPAPEPETIVIEKSPYSEEQIAVWKVAEAQLKPAQRDLIAAIVADPKKSNEALSADFGISAQTVAKWRRACVEAGVVAKARSGRGRRVLRVEDKREFDDLWDAAETLIADGKTHGKVESVRQNLWAACKDGRRAYDYTWKYI